MDEFKTQMLNAAVKVITTAISEGYASNDNFELQQKNLDEYHKKIKKIIKKQKKKQKIEYEDDFVDMSDERIESGESCLPCSRDHFSTASALLNESLRFAREDGVGDIEVQRRLGMALDELNVCERVDLVAENIINMKGKEKEIAEKALKNSRNLRHEITAVKTAQDLEKVSAKAANIRTEFMTDIFSLTPSEDTINKLCEDLEGEELSICKKSISSVIEKKGN